MESQQQQQQVQPQQEMQAEAAVPGMSAYLDSLRWSKDGLVPVIVQVSHVHTLPCSRDTAFASLDYRAQGPSEFNCAKTPIQGATCQLTPGATCRLSNQQLHAGS